MKSPLLLIGLLLFNGNIHAKGPLRIPLIEPAFHTSFNAPLALGFKLRLKNNKGLVFLSSIPNNRMPERTVQYNEQRFIHSNILYQFGHNINRFFLADYVYKTKHNCFKQKKVELAFGCAYKQMNYHSNIVSDDNTLTTYPNRFKSHYQSFALFHSRRLTGNPFKRIVPVLRFDIGFQAIYFVDQEQNAYPGTSPQTLAYIVPRPFMDIGFELRLNFSKRRIVDEK